MSTEVRDMGFPENSLGLVRGSLLRAIDPNVSQLGLTVGDVIPIGYDGEYVRSGSFTWSIEQLVEEVGWGIWEVAGVCDLSTEENDRYFQRLVEHRLSAVVIDLN